MIQGSEERAERAAVLRGSHVFGPVASPWPCPQHSPICRGLKEVILLAVLFVMSSPGFYSSSSLFLVSEVKVIPVLPPKEGLTASAGQQQCASSTGLWEEMGYGCLNRTHCSQGKRGKFMKEYIWVLVEYLRDLSFFFLSCNVCHVLLYPDFSFLQASSSQIPVSAHVS